jgi:hypothetical protein
MKWSNKTYGEYKDKTNLWGEGFRQAKKELLRIPGRKQ